MSKCMTIADEAIDQRDTCTELGPKEIVEFILEEALLSAFIILDKGCSRIGDFNIAEDFRQQFDQISILKDFEQVESSRNQSAGSQESNLISGGNADRSSGLVTTKENLELIIDSFVKKDDKIKPPGECKVITEDVLADNELQIQNGQIHIEKNKTDKVFPEPERQKYFDKEDIIKDEKIEIEYFNEGKLNKIYVPLNPFNGSTVECSLGLEQKKEKDPAEGDKENVTLEVTEERNAPEECAETKTEVSLENVSSEEDTERPFKPYVTEVRQVNSGSVAENQAVEEWKNVGWEKLNLPVWGNGNSSSVGRWEGDVLAQREEAVKLMEELTCVPGQVFPDCSADPNRPRACAFAEEDVKKMIREIEEISFAQNCANCEDFDLAYNPDGQGDADLESKSFINSLKNAKEAEKSGQVFTGFISESDSGDVKNDPEAQKIRERERTSSGEFISSRGGLLSRIVCDFAPEVETSVTTSEVKANDAQNETSVPADPKPSVASLEGKQSLPRASPGEEYKLNYSLYNEIAMKAMEGTTDNPPSPILDVEPPRQPPLEGPPESECSQSCLSVSNSELLEKNDFFAKESVIRDFQSVRNVSEECFLEIASPSENTESNDNKLDDLTLRNLELISELDVQTFQGKRSDMIKGSRSFSDTQEIAPELNWQNHQGTISLGRLFTASSETYNRIILDSFSEDKNLELLSMDSNLFGLNAEEKRKSKEAGNLLQDSNSWSDRCESDFGKLQIEEDSSSNTDKINERVEETLNFIEENGENEENRENLEKRMENEGNYLMNQKIEEHLSLHDSRPLLSQSESEKSPSVEAMNNVESNGEDSSPSSQTQLNTEPLKENGVSEAPDSSEGGTRKFKLHSQKMYRGSKYEGKAGGPAPNEFTLTESEEALIDMTESVIQIIEPPENNVSEDSSKVSFSLLSEEPRRKLESSDVRPQVSLEKRDSSDIENSSKQVYSGMTTIGPIKNPEYDPKDLTAPEIDYGKMTRITSSRTLAKDMNLFSSDVTTVKIIEEDDSSDDNLSLNVEEDRLDRTSLVNRDIASLTKVQKVREVMSYQPKPEEDFEDEEALARPRLDLKDVESMTDERYKVPDVSIPLLSFEIGDVNLDAEKELMDSMGLVISGLTNPAFYEEDVEEDYPTIERNLIALNNEKEQTAKGSDISLALKGSSQVVKTAEGGTPLINLETEICSELLKENNPSSDGDSQHEGLSGHPKYGTLGSVFKRASSKLLRKDCDLFTRNSKSLPRDASKGGATESIRSLLDDCHSSASNVLKKSRSLLKNGQSILKSISQSRMTSEHGADHKKLSPSESDVTTIERKLSGFIKKEDFAKAKNLIMTKIERKFKNVDWDTPPSSPTEIPSGRSDLRVAVRNTRNLQVDRLENFKRLLPKSPLVYKSQFVKSQMSVRSGSQESQEPAPSSQMIEDEGNVEVLLKASLVEDTTCKISDEGFQEETDSRNPFASEENPQQQATDANDLKPSVQEDSKPEFDPKPPDFIVMETIPGLLASDLEGLSFEKVSGARSAENAEKIESQKGGNDLRNVEASNSSQTVADSGLGIAPCLPQMDEEKTSPKTPSERKIKTKKKKFTARFRSFWCSAFGRVKTPSKKGDLS